MNKLKKISFKNEEQNFQLNDTPEVENINSVQYCASNYTEYLCLFFCMEHIARQIGGEPSWKTYEELYRREYGQTSTREGVDPDDAIEFFNEYFKTYGCKSGYRDSETIQKALSEGAQMLGFIKGEGCSDNDHAVIIKSYNPKTDTYHIYDPQAEYLELPGNIVSKDIPATQLIKAIGGVK